MTHRGLVSWLGGSVGGNVVPYTKRMRPLRELREGAKEAQKARSGGRRVPGVFWERGESSVAGVERGRLGGGR